MFGTWSGDDGPSVAGPGAGRGSSIKRPRIDEDDNIARYKLWGYRTVGLAFDDSAAEPMNCRWCGI
jgi:hypothetical protein